MRFRADSRQTETLARARGVPGALSLRARLSGEDSICCYDPDSLWIGTRPNYCPACGGSPCSSFSSSSLSMTSMMCSRPGRNVASTRIRAFPILARGLRVDGKKCITSRFSSQRATIITATIAIPMTVSHPLCCCVVVSTVAKLIAVPLRIQIQQPAYAGHDPQ